MGCAVCWARQLLASPHRVGGKVNGGGWEDTHELQTAVLQSAISDTLDRPTSVDQDGRPPSLLGTTGRRSLVSCGTAAGTILFIEHDMVTVLVAITVAS